MISFKNFIIEAMKQTKMPEPKKDESGKAKVMSGKETMEHFPRSTMNAVMKHPLYRRHIAGAEHKGFAHSVNKSGTGDSKYDTHIVHAVTGGSGIRHRIDFHIGLSGRKVTHAEHFTNKDNEKYPHGHPAAGQVKWKNIT
jgi:hypothetical protein